MDRSGARFVPMVDLTHDGDDTDSHMSDIPLQLPASAYFPLNNSTFPRSHQQEATPRDMFTVFNRDQINRIESLAVTGILKVYLQFLDVMKRFNW